VIRDTLFIEKVVSYETARLSRKEPDRGDMRDWSLDTHVPRKFIESIGPHVEIGIKAVIVLLTVLLSYNLFQ